jgi:hypothetical protein
VHEMLWSSSVLPVKWAVRLRVKARLRSWASAVTHGAAATAVSGEDMIQMVDDAVARSMPAAAHDRQRTFALRHIDGANCCTL